MGNPRLAFAYGFCDEQEMDRTTIEFSETRAFPMEQVLALYRANAWSAADRPAELEQALRHAHCVISAWQGARLVGLGHTISDGFLVVYYAHLLVLPEFQRRGIGSGILRRLAERYRGFHQQVLIADHLASRFYVKFGFRRAGNTEPMWIFDGKEH